MDEYVVGHILSPDKTEVFFVKKDKPHKPYLHGKLFGFGGKIEEFDQNETKALIREVKEEVGIDIQENQIKYRGYVIDPVVGKVHVFDIFIDYKLEEGYIENEGFAKYYPLNYYKDNLHEFIKYDDIILEKCFFTKETLELDFREKR